MLIVDNIIKKDRLITLIRDRQLIEVQLKTIVNHIKLNAQ